MKPDWKDAVKMRPGKTVRIKDGRHGVVTGMMLTPDGPAVMVKDHPDRISRSTVLLSDVDELEGDPS